MRHIYEAGFFVQDMTRKKAFFVHLCISTLVIGGLLLLVLFFWYPYPFSLVAGIAKPLSILIGAYLIIGPLLTLILFKPGKAGLKFDMYLVSIIQSAVLLYGGYTLYQERPYYMVFVQDRFEVLAQGDIDLEGVTDPALLDKPWAQPIYVVALMPADVQEQQRILEETLFQGKPDIHQRPEYWHPYAAHLDKVSKRARPLEDLLERRPDEAVLINAAIRKSDNSESLAYMPIMGKRRVFSLLLESSGWTSVGVVSVDPWAKPSLPK